MAIECGPEFAAEHIDFDVVSAGVVARARSEHPEMAEAELLEHCKDARYAALADAVRAAGADDAAGGAGLVIVSAPFSQYTQDAALWQSWLTACGDLEAVDLVWLDLDPETRWQRMRERASVRDAVLLESGIRPPVSPRPAIPHRIIDAGLPVAEQVRRVVAGFDND